MDVAITGVGGVGGRAVARRARGGATSRAGVGGPLLVVVGVGVVGGGVALLDRHAPRQDGGHVEQRGHAPQRVVLARVLFATLLYFAEFYTWN